jgi:hypothetical protein
MFPQWHPPLTEYMVSPSLHITLQTPGVKPE